MGIISLRKINTGKTEIVKTAFLSYYFVEWTTQINETHSAFLTEQEVTKREDKAQENKYELIFHQNPRVRIFLCLLSVSLNLEAIEADDKLTHFCSLPSEDGRKVSWSRNNFGSEDNFLIKWFSSFLLRMLWRVSFSAFAFSGYEHLL